MRSEVPRTCIGCGCIRDKRSMLRIVKTSSGFILPDETGRLNGRGAYICFSEECLENAIKKHGFERTLKMSVPPESIKLISDHIKSALA